MANNRMLLVHVPTGLAVCIGKRMDDGWYTNDPETIWSGINELYSTIDELGIRGPERDAFALAMESSEGLLSQVGSWSYGDTDGRLVRLIIDGSKTHPS